MVFPLLIENAQHDHALVIAHGLGADKLFFAVVTRFQFLEYSIAEFLPVKSLRLDALSENVNAEACEDRVFEALDIPVCGMSLHRRILIE